MTETMIGIVFFVNTVVIVLAQLPVTKLTEGHRRMRTLGLLGVLWAGCWVLVPLAGSWVTGAAAAVFLAAIMAAFGIGECLHGSVQGPLVADLAEPSLMGATWRSQRSHGRSDSRSGRRSAASCSPRARAPCGSRAAALCLAAGAAVARRSSGHCRPRRAATPSPSPREAPRRHRE